MSPAKWIICGPTGASEEKGMWSFLCFCCLSFTCMWSFHKVDVFFPAKQAFHGLQKQMIQNPTSSAPNELTKQSYFAPNWSTEVRSSPLRVICKNSYSYVLDKG